MITYPVSQDSRFTFKSGEVVVRRQKWPRFDGMPLEGVPEGTVILIESESSQPSFDPLTQKLVGAWVDDITNQSSVWTWSVVQLSPEEAAEAADNADREAKRQLVANAIPTLRTWATQLRGITVTSGNAVATAQGLVDRLEVFFDRFADLLEAQRIDR